MRFVCHILASFGFFALLFYLFLLLIRITEVGSFGAEDIMWIQQERTQAELRST